MMGARNRACFLLCVVFLCFFLHIRPSVGAGTLSVGDSISGDQTIVSQGDGNFELGFCTAGITSNNYYIGIWYRKISEMTVVWVANRDEPLSDKYSSQLKLLEDGNLVILNPSKTIIWSTNLTPITLNNSTEAVAAVLLDSGNFALRSGSKSSVFIWESFDHPTNTLLPGGKIGNKLTYTSRRLTSWKNSMDPSPGFFSLELYPAGSSSQLIILWKEDYTHWTSGAWNGHMFNLVPEWSNYTFNFTYVSNAKENYLTYNLYNSSIISRFVLDVTGQIEQLVWLEGSGWNLFWAQPEITCKVNDLCRDFSACNQKAPTICRCLQGFSPRNQSNLYGGCVRNTPLHCVDNASLNVEKDGFLKMSSMRFPTNMKFVAIESLQACEVACLNNCSCNAYAFNGSCFGCEGYLMNLEQLSDGDIGAQDLYLKLAASELMNLTSVGNKKGSATGSIVGVVSGVVVLLGLLVMLIWTRQRRNLARPLEALEGYLVPFSYRDLKVATKSFSEMLGRGGFGSVFKGTLSESTVVAVKKLEGLGQGEKQFRTEVSTIGTIQHVNLVRLRGFCCEGTRRLLVYDFMPNGSLDSHLFHGKRDSKVLDWKMRYKIALGTARGLAYLHEKCRECIIHCDIKPENILLDAEFCPKVADFGMAKLLGRDFSRALTTMRGTIGYLAPEWISGVAITAKADVYSFGMMLFELISGRRNSDQSAGAKVGYFPVWAASKINEDGEILSLLDYRLEGNVDLADLHRACKVASWCIQDEEVHRPSMGLVVQILEGIVEVSTPPIPRRLEGLVENHFSKPFSNHILEARSSTADTLSEAMSNMSSRYFLT